MKQMSVHPLIRRYLEARNWNVDRARKVLEETLKWKSTYKPEQTRWHEVAHEGETGKVSRADFRDRSGRSVLIMRPGDAADGNIRHLTNVKTAKYRGSDDMPYHDMNEKLGPEPTPMSVTLATPAS
ncbi:hypothetical protein AgCh_032952 [Apium graveolens]